MASSSFPSPIQRSFYDVFLSFSGTDTRNTFTSHLLAALIQQGFSTFHDETKLEKGEDIHFQLPKAISESRVSIVVFSKSYAASGWCLDELVKIMDCKRDFKQIVLPIFYDVDPSDVRYQGGFYTKAFEKHGVRFKGTSSMERLRRWKEALTQAANLSGWHLQNVVDRNEAKLIKIVVTEVIHRLDQLYCDVADHPVGIDSRVQELKGELKLESDDVTIVAIWGVGGIGKTTIAKAVFNSIRNMFEGSSFLADVSETTKLPFGVVTLQKQLLSNILRNDTHSLDNRHQGIELIKEKLRHRRVLLVLDDVDDVEHLKMLAINRDLFFAGSKIIITTRNKSSLTPIQVDSLYSPAELNHDESLKLFSWNAFKTDYPEEGYLELSKEVVAYVEGLPLALEVLGSSFGSMSNNAEWESSLKKFRKHLPKGIHGKLKISFDLLDTINQDLFLDIAFFFIGRDKEFAVKVLEDSECFPENGIGELVRRCLIQVDKFNKLRMHNLLQEMAREIVFQESSKEPGKRSRLRGLEVLEVLRDSTGSEAIEGLYLELLKLNNEEINVGAFADMRNLRLLHLNYLCHLSGTNLTASRKLKWLCWHGFPLARIPDDLYVENLVAVDLQYSRLKQIWKGPKRLDKLRFLNLSYSCYLTKTPDFSGLKNLEELLLNDCTNLVEVDNSIGCLGKLVILNMANCRSLRKVPSSILMLTSLRDLNLSGCSVLELGESRGLVSRVCRLLPYYRECVPLSVSASSTQIRYNLRFLNLSYSCCLTKTPDFSGLKNLEELLLNDCTNLVEVDNSIGCLGKLVILNMANCRSLRKVPSSFFMLTSLRYLNLSGCSLFEGGESGGLLSMFWRRLLPNYQECVSISPAVSLQGLSGLQVLNLSLCSLSNVPSEIGDLTLLKKLDLSGNKFSSIPSTLSNLLHLNQLGLSNCVKLEHLPLLPNSLKYLWADNCLSLESETVGAHCTRLRKMRFLNCPKLDDKKIARDIIRSFRGGFRQISFFLPGGELPLDLDFYGSGSETTSYVVPKAKVMGMKIRGWILRAVLSILDTDFINYRVCCGAKNIGEYGCEIVRRKWFHLRKSKVEMEMMWVSCVGLSKTKNEFLEEGDEAEIGFFISLKRVIMRKWGIKWIYEGDENAPVLNGQII